MSASCYAWTALWLYTLWKKTFLSYNNHPFLILKLGPAVDSGIYPLISCKWIIFKVGNSHFRKIVQNCNYWCLVYFLNCYLKVLQFFHFLLPHLIYLQFAWILQQSQVLIRWIGTNCFLAGSNLKPEANSQGKEVGVCIVAIVLFTISCSNQ